MTDQVLRPDGTGFDLAGGELTVAGAAEQAIDAGSSPPGTPAFAAKRSMRAGWAPLADLLTIDGLPR